MPMVKVILLALVAMLVPIAAFAEANLELETSNKTIKSYDTVLVSGKITGVKFFNPGTLTVIAPDGETLYSPKVPLDDAGEFKRLIHPPITGFKQGTYSIVLTHPDTKKTTEIQFTVTPQNVPRKDMMPAVELEDIPTITTEPDSVKNPMYIIADAMEGDDEIKIFGKTILRDQSVSISIKSPQGNLVSVAQLMPNAKGEFSTSIVTGGPLWKEDGIYTVTAYQGRSSELKSTVDVEIVDGRIIPEFGTIAALVLVSSIASIIVLSRTKYSLFPRL